MGDDERMRPGLVALIGLPSLALGIGPLAAPQWLALALGLPPTPTVHTAIRLVGLRELLVAVGFLRRPRPSWMGAFLAQDAMDLAGAAWLLGRRVPRSARRFGCGLLGYTALAVVDGTVTRHERRAARGSAAGSAPFGPCGRRLA